VTLKRGDLVRWIVDHDVYEADGNTLRGIKPNYRHGIIMEVSKKDGNAVIICCTDCKKHGNWLILNLIHDEFEVLSEAQNI
jgi:hypothetical protein|tara:strand:+ start:181 stop:423 length:243 start_codon:yes stop_codon:yes gene_type:complete